MRIWIILVIGATFISCAKNTVLDQELTVGEELMIPMRDGKSISASLLKAGGGEKPAVVIVVGSGAFSYRTYWRPKTFGIWKLIAESFVKQGYSVLLLEKRGINKSEGNWKKSDLYKRADDVVDAIRFISKRSDIDAANIGICGHSQGGWVAQLVATRNPEITKFVITLAGPAVSVKDQVLQDHKSEWICEGLEGEELEAKVEKKDRGLNRLISGSKTAKVNHLSRIIDYDPEETISKMSTPLLAIFAENDQLVPPGPNIRRLRQFFPADQTLEVLTIDSANHFFIPAAFCSEWSQLKPGFAASFDSLLNNWSFLRLDAVAK